MEPVPTPGGVKPKKGKLDRRKLMIYGGVGAALLLLVLLSRRSSSSSATSNDPGTATLAGSEAIPTGTGGGDGGGGLSTGTGSIDDGTLQNTLNQLPDAITSAVSAGVSSGLSGGQVTGGGTFSDFLGALGSAGLTITAGGGLAGEQNGPATTAGGGRTATATQHPAFKTETVVNAKTHTTQVQHVYDDGHKVVVSSKPTMPNRPTGGGAAAQKPANQPTASFVTKTVDNAKTHTRQVQHVYPDGHVVVVSSTPLHH